MNLEEELEERLFRLWPKLQAFLVLGAGALVLDWLFWGDDVSAASLGGLVISSAVGFCGAVTLYLAMRSKALDPDVMTSVRLLVLFATVLAVPGAFIVALALEHLRTLAGLAVELMAGMSLYWQLVLHVERRELRRTLGTGRLPRPHAAVRLPPIRATAPTVVRACLVVYAVFLGTYGVALGHWGLLEAAFGAFAFAGAWFVFGIVFGARGSDLVRLSSRLLFIIAVPCIMGISVVVLPERWDSEGVYGILSAAGMLSGLAGSLAPDEE